MSKPRIIGNNSCVRCNSVEHEMVLVGSIVMCHACFTAEFTSDDPVRQEREKYLAFLLASYAKLDAEYTAVQESPSDAE